MSKKIKKFDCIEMKCNIQENIYEETRHISREEYLAFIRKHVDESPFGKLLKANSLKHELIHK